MHRSDIDRADWDFRLVEELKKRFKGTDGGSLYADTFSCLIDILLKDVNQVSLDLINSILNFLLVGALEELRTSNRIIESGRGDFNTHGSLDLVMVLILTLHTHFFHWEWGQERSNVSLNWSVESRNDNCITNF